MGATRRAGCGVDEGDRPGGGVREGPGKAENDDVGGRVAGGVRKLGLARLGAGGIRCPLLKELK